MVPYWFVFRKLCMTSLDVTSPNALDTSIFSALPDPFTVARPLAVSAAALKSPSAAAL